MPNASWLFAHMNFDLQKKLGYREIKHLPKVTQKKKKNGEVGTQSR